MTVEELKLFLKENLGVRIEYSEYYNSNKVEVTLLLGNEVISTSWDYVPIQD